VIPSTLPGPALLRLLNGLAPDIYFSRAHAVTGEFNPRRAESRTYLYLASVHDHDPTVWQRLAARFVRPVDARTFGRGVPLDRPTWRTITEAQVRVEGEWIVLELTAPAFVWGMVRKIVAAIASVEAGDLAVEDLDAAVRGERRLTLPLADPLGLILWEVRYPFSWEVGIDQLPVHVERRCATTRRAAELRVQVLNRLFP
jgi:tRNA pseudouridine(38-40) synthase